MTTTIMLLVGTSSAGKSTLSKALQAILPEHYLLLGLDDVFRMVSPRWGGGLGGPLSYHGFRYEPAPAGPVITIRYGAVGRAVLDGMHYAVAAFAQAGTSVIVDEMLLDRDVLSNWARVLAPCQTYLIKVQAPLATLEEREVQRGNPLGLARGHYAVNDVPFFDRLVETTHTSARDAASELALWLQTNPQPTALQQYVT
ncbi:MAG: AAA family ATPase [Chloroflexales bacterium]|nr:AAA family ATPase [Chloroflexales bacterium]